MIDVYCRVCFKSNRVYYYSYTNSLFIVFIAAMIIPLDDLVAKSNVYKVNTYY